MKLVLLTFAIIAISVLLLGIRIFFMKNGKFPNGHVSGNKALREKGVTCVQSQDRDAQMKY